MRNELRDFLKYKVIQRVEGILVVYCCQLKEKTRVVIRENKVEMRRY